MILRNHLLFIFFIVFLFSISAVCGADAATDISNANAHDGLVLNESINADVSNDFDGLVLNESINADVSNDLDDLVLDENVNMDVSTDDEVIYKEDFKKEDVKNLVGDDVIFEEDIDKNVHTISDYEIVDKYDKKAKLSSNVGTFSDLYKTIWDEIEWRHSHLSPHAKIHELTRPIEIWLDKDYVYNPETDADYKDGVRVVFTVYIYGGQHTIDGANQARLFRASSLVVLHDMTLKNGCCDGKGNDGNGGAICDGCTAKNCIFINNKAVRGGAMYGGHAIGCKFFNNTASEGSALYNASAENCSFQRNSASNAGTMVYGSADKCNFTENTADIGAAIAEGSAKDCIFRDNKAITCGGALFNSNALNCSFFKNDAYIGGAMEGGNATNCTFIGNHAKFFGGAMSSGNAVSCMFFNNSAQTGGAVYECNVSNSTFFHNSAETKGSEDIYIYPEHFSDYTIENCTFIDPIMDVDFSDNDDNSPIISADSIVGDEALNGRIIAKC